MKLVFDVESTGLDPWEDEILQLSIMDQDGNVLFNDYFEPEYVYEWPDAEAINGISPLMVEGKESFVSRINEIQEIFDQADELIGYNVNFDISMLRESGIRIPNVKIRDVMRDFAPIYGLWDHVGGCYRNVKLVTCAKYYGYTFDAHDSLEDTKATLYCYQQLIKEENSIPVSKEGTWCFSK